MLGKLIKHEFKATARLIPIMMGASLLLFGLFELSHALKLSGLVATAYILLILALAGMLLIAFIVAFMRYYKSMVTNEAHLSFTLPVKPGELYFSRLIVSAAWALLSFILFVVLLLFSVATMLNMSVGDMFSSMRGSIEGLGAANIFTTSFWVTAVILVLYSGFSLLVSGYFCLTVSAIRPFERMRLGAAALCALALYLANEIIGGVLVFFLPLGITVDQNGWAFATQSMYSGIHAAGNTQVIGIGSIIYGIVMCVVLLFLTVRLTRTRLNVR